MEVNAQASKSDVLSTGFPADSLARLESAQLDWQRLTGTPKFDYVIDYSVAVTCVDQDAGMIEFIAKWAPNAYCHFHRHLGRTATIVLEGEHHIVETNQLQTLHKTRRPGFQGQAPAGEIHMEYGGAAGSTVLFRCEAVDGKLFDVVATNGKILATATIEDFVAGRLR
jgi:hypothetical protein